MSFEFLHGYPIYEYSIARPKKSIVLKAIIDTGSPYTIISTEKINELGITENEKIGDVTIRGVIHKEECSEKAPTYQVDITFSKRLIQGVAVVGYDFHPKYGIIGHNILKNFKLFINWEKKIIKLE